MAGTIFISCGQYTEAERSLGQSICDLVREVTSFEPYFAENQRTLDDLSKNVFAALDGCSGFIAIMHHRGSVATPHGDSTIRGSVWVEQEIAIAAFLQNFGGRKISVRIYLERGIAREGLRDKLILNPIEFETNEEVIDDLTRVLPEWQNSARPSVSLDITHRNRSGSRLDYTLLIGVENHSTKTVRNYCVEALFPTPFITSTSHARHVPGAGPPGYQVYRVTSDDGLGPIYPGSPVHLLSFDYYINKDNPGHQNALHQEAVVRLYADDQLVDEIRTPISELT
jgi:hypothetical protein